jgi:hypothetical protein
MTTRKANPAPKRFHWHMSMVLCLSGQGISSLELREWCWSNLGHVGVRWDLSYAVESNELRAMLWLASEEDWMLARMIWDGQSC